MERQPLADRAGLERFEQLRALHRRAVVAGAAEVSDWCCLFAGRPARIRIVGRHLADVFVAAFGHLAIAPIRTELTPELTIDLWDESVAGFEMDGETDVEVGRTWLVGNGLLTSSCGGRLIRHELPHTAAWLDRESCSIIGAVSSADDLSLYERGKPLHYLLSLWHNDRRAFITHGALVARHGMGMLLGGIGGSGKSTLAAACLCQGFDYLGDDCIAVERTAPQRFVGHSVFGSPWLDRAALAQLPRLAARAIVGDRPGEDKAFVDLRGIEGIRLIPAVEIRAIVLPRVRHVPTPRVYRCEPGETMRALAPSSILLFAPSTGADGLAHLAALVGSVPSFWLDLSDDVCAAPDALELICQQLPGGYVST